MRIEQCVLNDTTLIIVVGRITYNAQVFRRWFPISKCYYDDQCRFRIIIHYYGMSWRSRVLRRNCSAQNPAVLRSSTRTTSSRFFTAKERSTTLITRVPFRFFTFITSLCYTSCKCGGGDTISTPRRQGSASTGLSRNNMIPWKPF